LKIALANDRATKKVCKLERIFPGGEHDGLNGSASVGKCNYFLTNPLYEEMYNV